MKIIQIKGFTLLATLFILIILAMAGTYLIKIGLTQVQIINYSLLRSRAHFALESVLGMLEQQWKTDQSCKDTTFNFDKQAQALNGFEVKVNCLQTYQYPSQSPTFIAVQLKVSASHGSFGERDYVNYQRTKWFVLDKSNAAPSNSTQPLK